MFSLRLKLALLVFTTVLLVCGSVSLLIYHTLEQQLVETHFQRGNNLIKTLNYAVEQVDEPSELIQIVQAFGAERDVKIIFEKLLSVIEAYEGITINSVKNAILCTARSHFLAIKPKKAWLDIEFVLDEKVDEFPIYKTIQATKTKWAHFIRLGSPHEIDEQLISWLKRSYEVSK